MEAIHNIGIFSVLRKLATLLVLLSFLAACTSPTAEPPTISDPMISDPTPQEPGKEVGISIDVSSAGGATLTYTWNADGGEIVRGQGSPAITYRVPEEPGTYNVRVKVEWDGQSVERVTTIEVKGDNIVLTDTPNPTRSIPTSTPQSEPSPTVLPTTTVAPSSFTSYTLNVPADDRWVETNICLKAGQSVQITARGEIYLEGNHNKQSPNGEGVCEDATWGHCSLAGAGWGTLLGRFDDDSPFVIGAYYQVTVQKTGCLQLGINDTNLDDNMGSYTVQIEELSTSKTNQDTSACFSHLASL